MLPAGGNEYTLKSTFVRVEAIQVFLGTGGLQTGTGRSPVSSSE